MFKIFEWLKNPEVIALIIGIPVFLRALGELFKLIGKIIPGEDWAEGLSAKLSNIAKYIGKFITWFGIGNPKK